jgi:hypothetical protein
MVNRRAWRLAWWKNRWTRIGLLLVLIGWTPLWGIVLLAAIGWWPDPNPNPIGPGLLFFVTAWPAIFCLGRGLSQSLTATRELR